LEDNTLWDGLFHLATWVLVTAGLFMIWLAMAAGYRGTRRGLVGLLLAGWGLFNLVEGVVDHHILTILTIHHVRDDVADPLRWDLGFLALGAALVAVGYTMRRNGADPDDRRRNRETAA
jgi:uncharacterized membrane protein